MWQVKSVRSGEELALLEEGWEPFGAVSHDISYLFYNTTLQQYRTEPQNTDYVYLRKLKEDDYNPFIGL